MQLTAGFQLGSFTVAADALDAVKIVSEADVAVVATNFERHLLWRQFSDAGISRHWKQEQSGHMKTVASSDGRPVCLSFSKDFLFGHPVMFIEQTSMIEHNGITAAICRAASGPNGKPAIVRCAKTLSSAIQKTARHAALYPDKPSGFLDCLFDSLTSTDSPRDLESSRREAMAILQNPRMPGPVFFAIEASSFETERLIDEWRENRGISNLGARRTSKTMSPCLVNIGTFNGEPTLISVECHDIDKIPVMFYRPASCVVDHKEASLFVESLIEPSASKITGGRNYIDAQNANNIFHNQAELVGLALSLAHEKSLQTSVPQPSRAKQPPTI